MNAEIYSAIQTEWRKISSHEQRKLIYLFVEGGGMRQLGSWMEFLATEFGLEGIDVCYQEKQVFTLAASS